MDQEKLSDRGYKALFSHPQMVEDLLRCFVNEEFLRHLDFSTLQKVNQSFVTDELKQRESDVIWRVHILGEPAFLYLLLEFQSTVERFMAVRLLSYVSLLYLDFLKTHTPARLPPVFPLVLYRGEERWTAPQDLSDLIEVPVGSLQRYVPKFCYGLVAENELSRDALLELETLVAGVFLLETSDRSTVGQAVARVCALLQQEMGPDLRRDFTAWARRAVQRDFPDIDPFTLNPQEVAQMLEASLRKERDDAFNEGELRGELRGERRAVKLLLANRFGDDAQALDTWIDSLEDPEVLHAVLLRAATATTLQDVRGV